MTESPLGGQPLEHWPVAAPPAGADKPVDVLILMREPTDEVTAISMALRARGRSYLAVRPSELTIACAGDIRVLAADGGAVLPRVVLGWFSLWERAFGLQVLHAFDAMGIPIENDRQVIEICQSKALTSLCLTRAGLPHVATEILGGSAHAEDARRRLGSDVVVKPDVGAKGDGVRPVDDWSAIEHRSGGEQAPPPLLLQRRLDRPDRDIRVQCIDFEPAFSYLRHARPGEFLTNLHAGGRLEYPGPWDDALRDLSRRAARACGARMAGVDLVETADGYRIIEVNSVPGFITFARFHDGAYARYSQVGHDCAGALADLLIRAGGQG